MSLKRKAAPVRREAKQIGYRPDMAPARAEIRMIDPRARMCMAVKKDKPVRSEAYRRLVAAMPCINCGAEGMSQAAHGPTLGRSIKADDRTCMPLCVSVVAGNCLASGCHEAFDTYLLFPRAERAEMAKQWAAQTRAAIKAAGQWPASLPTWGEEC